MITIEELKQIKERIIASGALGRSKVYARLLEYLVQCSLEKRTPKEIEIAIDVMDRNSDFDVAKDSLVRVYIHNLRKKLAEYYAKYGPEENWLVEIPKGQYTLQINSFQSIKKARSANSNHSANESLSSKFLNLDWLHWVLATAVILLTVGFVFYKPSLDVSEQPSGIVSVDSHPFWATVLNDSKPILIVLGDYYIFGESNPATGEINRLVREFNINSRQDLENQILSNPLDAERLRNLDLNYLPTGIAFALRDILPILEKKHDLVTVKTMSELDTSFLKSHHIIYLGYLSALDKLKYLVFEASRYEIGFTADEIVDRSSGEHFFSSAGIPRPNQRFLDYSFISTFPTPDDTQITVIAGTRDSGLMHSAQSLSQFEFLSQILPKNPGAHSTQLAFEALVEVFGYDGKNFDAKLIGSTPLNTQDIWGGDMTIAIESEISANDPVR